MYELIPKKEAKRRSRNRPRRNRPGMGRWIATRSLAAALLCLVGSIQKASGLEEETEKVYSVPPPLVYQGLYPCQSCHRKDARGVNSALEKGNAFLGTYIRVADPRPRVLVRMHRDIELKHANEVFWCLNCHSQDERNYLHLLNGKKIPFEESYRLCGQCHGSIYRDWKLGIHGRRVGQWNGKKLYLLCAHCHDPHQPKFRKLPGKEAPKPPSYGRWENRNVHR